MEKRNYYSVTGERKSTVLKFFLFSLIAVSKQKLFFNVKFRKIFNETGFKLCNSIGLLKKIMHDRLGSQKHGKNRKRLTKMVHENRDSSSSNKRRGF